MSSNPAAAIVPVAATLLQLDDLKAAGSLALALAQQSCVPGTSISELAALLVEDAAANCPSPAAPPTNIPLHFALAAALDSLLTNHSDVVPACNLLEPAIVAACLPLLQLDSRRLQQQMLESTAGVIVRNCAWPFAVKVLQACYATSAADLSGVLPSSVGLIKLGAVILEAIVAADQETLRAAALVLRCAADTVFPAALNMLIAGGKTMPAAAVTGRSMLPAALAAAEAAGQLPSCLKLLWQTCRRMGSSSQASEVRTGLALLVQFCLQLLQLGGIAQDEGLWALLLRALSSENAMDKKRALHVLESTLSHLQRQQQGTAEGGAAIGIDVAAWATFVKLYVTVNDTSMHLFKEAWPEVDRVHPPEGAPESDTLLPLPLSWVLLLWRKALQHRHITAQKLAAVSFVQRAWPASLLARLPPLFAAEVLIPVLGMPVMHRGELCEEIQSGAMPLFRRWSQELPVPARLELLGALLTTLRSRQQQRTTVAFASRALAEAARCGLGDSEEAQEELLCGIRAAGVAQPGFGANFTALAVFDCLADAVASCVTVRRPATLNLVGAWLESVPLPLLQPGTLLHAKIVAWFANTPQHAAAVRAAMAELVAHHLRASEEERKKERKEERKEERSGAIEFPSAGRVAVLALLVAQMELSDGLLHAQFYDGLSSVLGRAESDLAIDAWVPLLSALIAVCTPLSGRRCSDSRTSQGRWVLQEWLCATVLQAESEFAKLFERHAAWLMGMALPSAVESLASGIEDTCTAAGLSQEAALDDDKALPASYLQRRNVASTAVACAAGIARLLTEQQQQQQEQQRLKIDGEIAGLVQYISLTLQFVKLCIATYPGLCCALHGCQAGSTQQRGYLEVAIAMLRPLVSCCSLLADSQSTAAGQLTQAELCSLLKTLMDGLMAVAMPPPPPEEKRKKERKKKGKGGPLKPLTLRNWHDLLSWRAVEGTLAQLNASSTRAAAPPSFFSSKKEEKEGANSNSVELLASTLSDAVQALLAVPEGSNTVMPLIRCIRFVLPSLVDHSAAMAPLVSKNAAQSFALKNGKASEVGPPTANTLNGVVRWIGDTLLLILGAHVRKRTGMAAAIVSCCMHPCLFDPSRGEAVAALHRPEDGAMRDLVRKLMTAAGRNSRLHVLLSVQLAALLAAWPVLSPCYTDLVVELCLQGLDEDSSQNLRDVPLDQPTVAELAAVLEPLDPELSRAHAASPAAPRVSMICLCSLWARSPAGSAGQAAAAATYAALLKLSLTDPELSSPRYLYNGTTHRKKVRAWQALTVLSPAVPATDAASTLCLLIEALDVSNAASVKQYQECMALGAVLQRPGLLRAALLPKLRDYSQQRTDSVPSLIAVAAVAVLQLEPSGKAPSAGECTKLPQGEWEELLQATIAAIAPWACSFVHANRTFAQLVMWRVMELYPWVQAGDPALAAVFQFFETNSDLIRLRAALGMAAALEKFDLDRATTPRGVLCEELGLMASTNVGGVVEGAPVCLMEALQGFLQQERHALQEHLASAMAENAKEDDQRKESPPISHAPQHNGIAASSAPSHAEAAPDRDAVAYQRKITPSDKEAAVIDPWGAVLGLSARSSPDHFDARVLLAAESDAVAARGGARQDLIVVASLIDRLPNLAGLARTCEVFRAGRLVLADAKVAADPQFSSISVSAQHWVPIEEVPPASLESWLRRKAAEGYALIGLEQTGDSTPLPAFEFPRRSVLLLGAEKEGVPADLLQLLHSTVEIPQLGVVRSLNVHVSAALAIYEYTTQGRGERK